MSKIKEPSTNQSINKTSGTKIGESALKGTAMENMVNNAQQLKKENPEYSVPPNYSPGVSRRKHRFEGEKICKVCGDKAVAFNFDVISCESCKTFFRRNANKAQVSVCHSFFYDSVFFI